MFIDQATINHFPMAKYYITLKAAEGCKNLLYIVYSRKSYLIGEISMSCSSPGSSSSISLHVFIIAMPVVPQPAHKAGAGKARKNEVLFTSAAVTFLLRHSLHGELFLPVLDSRSRRFY